MILLTLLLCSWLVLTGAQSDDDNATLSNIRIMPCSGITIQTVSLYKSDIYTVANNLSFCGNLWNPNATIHGFSVNAYAHEVEENNLTNTPVVFIARQQKDGIVSWGIPLQPQGFKTLFYQVNRTVCPISLQQRPDNLPLLYVDVFSSSPTPVSYTISVEPVIDFVIKVAAEGEDGIFTSVVTGASAPQIRYVKFPDDAEVLAVQVEADDPKCAIVSIQNNTCPVNDLLRTATSRGIFQTMSKSAFITVSTDDVNDREFLIIIITTNYSVCHGTGYIPGQHNGTEFEQQVKLRVKRIPPLYSSHIGGAIALPMIVFLVVGLLGALAAFFPKKFHLVPFGCCSHPRNRHNDKPDQLLPKISLHTNYQSTADLEVSLNSHGSVTQNSGDVEIKRKGDDNLSGLPSDESQKPLKKLYQVYGWNTITVSIFYALPAFQLVVSEQRGLHSSGNQDQCYYNFKCAYPFGILSALNNVWSNIGYVVMGITFLIIVTIKKFLYKRKDKDYINSHGVYQYFGIYYAMGIGLVTEGFMSAFYHICPTNANFQFDTAFMFIIGGIFLVKVFQNRRPEIHANAFLAFFSFAVLIFFTLIGLYYDHRNPLAVRIIMFLIVLALVLTFLISFYHFHELSLVKNTLAEIFNDFRSFCTSDIKHKSHFYTLLLAFIVNIVLALVSIIGYQALNIATCIVIFFLVNVSCFLSIYFIKKLWYKEPFTLFALVLPLFVVVFWGTAFFFFFSHVSDWTLTPAESRVKNEDCKILSFYDNHDIWHFLSAFAMFFTFLFMLVMDDGVRDVNRKQLNVF